MRNARIAILLCTLSLLSLGLVMLWGIDSVDTRHHGHSSHFFLGQLGWAALGLAIMVAVARMDYASWRRFTLPVLVAAIALVLVSPFLGLPRRGASSDTVAEGLPFRPALTCVTAMVFCLASYRAWRKPPSQSTQDVLGHATEAEKSGLLTTGLTLYAVFSLWWLLVRTRESSFGLLLALTALIVLLVGGTKRWLVAGAYGAIAIGFALWLRADRLSWLLFIDFYTRHFDATRCRPITEIALSNGGWLGVGIGNGVLIRHEDPLRATDFIGNIIGEELGWLALIGLLVVYAGFVIAGFLVSIKARDNWGLLLGLGITSLVGLQTMLNLAVVTSLVRLQAPPLPLVSYAGTDLTMTLACVGLLLSIAKHSEDPNTRRTD